MDAQIFSTTINGIITLLVGGVGLLLYRRQKADAKQNAAIVLLTEIRNAETAIRAVKDSLRDTNTVPDVTVLPVNSWDKYSNLFASDFDRDEIELMNKFYADAERVSKNVAQVNNLFLMQVEKRTDAIQSTNLRIIQDAASVEEAKNTLSEFETKLWADGISSSPYVPSGFYNRLFKYLPEIQFILPTVIGSKLKKLAKMD